MLLWNIKEVEMMRQKREYRIFTFHTTAAAMEMEAFCREQGIRGRLVPVPRELSAGCGIAWRMEPAEYERFQGVIAESQIEIEQSCVMMN